MLDDRPARRLRGRSAVASESSIAKSAARLPCSYYREHVFQFLPQFPFVLLIELSSSIIGGMLALHENYASRA